MANREVWPMYLPREGLRTRVKAQVGEVLLPWCPKTVARLRAGKLSDPASPLEQCLVAGLVWQHRRNGTLDEIAALHDWAWSQETAIQYHSRYEKRFHAHFLARHEPLIVPRLREALAASAVTSWSGLCEIGCGSGLVLHHLSTVLGELHEFVGIDLSEAQCRLNRQRFAATALRFEAADAVEWLRANARPGRVYFTNGGVYEYFSATRLRSFFSQLAHDQAPAIVALVEPLDAAFELGRGLASHAFGYENTFSHDYPAMLTDAGFEIGWQAESRVDGQRWLLLVATVNRPAVSAGD